MRNESEPAADRRQGSRHSAGLMLFIGRTTSTVQAFARVWARLACLLRIFGGAGGG